MNKTAEKHKTIEFNQYVLKWLSEKDCTDIECLALLCSTLSLVSCISEHTQPQFDTIIDGLKQVFAATKEEYKKLNAH